MTTQEFREIQCPMSMFSDLQLVAIDKAAEAYHAAGAVKIAFLIGQAAEHELERRSFNRQNPTNQREAAYGRIRVPDWSDRDIADALILCWGMTDHTRNPDFGELMDALGNVFCEVAAERLRAHHDRANPQWSPEQN